MCRIPPRRRTGSRHRRIGPAVDPPPAWPLDPGPNAQYATASPTVDTPASSAVLLHDAWRRSTDRTNSPGTITVSPAQCTIVPGRDSTDSTARVRPASEGPTYRPRTTSTFGPRYRARASEP